MLLVKCCTIVNRVYDVYRSVTYNVLAVYIVPRVTHVHIYINVSILPLPSKNNEKHKHSYIGV
jgi:hypothetical protein